MNLSELPEPYKSLAEKNRDEQGIPTDYPDDIAFSFRWKTTKEGWDFWDTVFGAETESELPPIPETV